VKQRSICIISYTHITPTVDLPTRTRPYRVTYS